MGNLKCMSLRTKGAPCSCYCPGLSPAGGGGWGGKQVRPVGTQRSRRQAAPFCVFSTHPTDKGGVIPLPNPRPLNL